MSRRTAFPSASFVIDTNVITELMRAERGSQIVRWVSERIPDGIAVAAVTTLEIERGIHLLPVGRRREDLVTRWLDVRQRIVIGVIHFDENVAKVTAEYMAHCQRQGRRMDDALPDALIAGTVLAHSRTSGRVTLATRNLKDFEVLRDYALEPHHLRLLQAACEAWDRMGQARQALADHGRLTFTDERGTIRAHPAVAMERDARTAFARLVRELDLDAGAPSETPRPPALHSNRRT